MADLPDSKRGLRALAERGRSAAKRAATISRERREGRNELLGAAVVLPLVRDFSPMIPLINQLGMPAPLQAAAVSYTISMFTKGMLSEAMWGSTLGALGAWSYSQQALLGGLLGGQNQGG